MSVLPADSVSVLARVATGVRQGAAAGGEQRRPLAGRLLRRRLLLRAGAAARQQPARLAEPAQRAELGGQRTEPRAAPAAQTRRRTVGRRLTGRR